MTKYKIDTLSEIQIYNYLKENDSAFEPPFSSNVNLLEYSQKLRSRAKTFEAWEQGRLIGLLAAYVNNKSSYIYVPYICVVKKGEGRSLFFYFLSRLKNYKNVDLEVKKNNSRAVNFYRKIGFEIITENDSKYQMRLEL